MGQGRNTNEKSKAAVNGVTAPSKKSQTSDTEKGGKEGGGEGAAAAGISIPARFHPYRSNPNLRRAVSSQSQYSIRSPMQSDTAAE